MFIHSYHQDTLQVSLNISSTIVYHTTPHTLFNINPPHIHTYIHHTYIHTYHQDTLTPHVINVASLDRRLSHTPHTHFSILTHPICTHILHTFIHSYHQDTIRTQIMFPSIIGYLSHTHFFNIILTNPYVRFLFFTFCCIIILAGSENATIFLYFLLEWRP